MSLQVIGGSEMGVWAGLARRYGGSGDAGGGTRLASRIIQLPHLLVGERSII